ncbi:MAG: response regulator transcription factor [Bacteroidetes bacterium]|nr:response regulator transcription factor [Bacteroidota bacterium]
MEKKINVVITDDHKLFRKGIAALLSDFDFVGEILEAANGVELLKLLERLDSRPDVILLDIRMPEMDGIETQKRIRLLYPEIKIIILSMEDDEHVVLHLVEEGVNGYLLKNADPDEMEFALKKVVNEDFYFSNYLSELIVKNVARKISGKYEIEEILTEKELQVLNLICKQNTAAEIADHLNLSVRTIEGYRRKLLEKTKSKNLAGLVVFAIKNNLVSI